jgi:integrase
MLEGYFMTLLNEAGRTKVDNTQIWRDTLDFVRTVLRMRGASDASLRDASDHLETLEDVLGGLTPSMQKRIRKVRALPGNVVEALLELADPANPNNPFRTEATRWCVVAVLFTLLFQGLRRGEACGLRTGAFKQAADGGKVWHWLNVQGSDGEEDHRYELPGLKTVQSQRQIPVEPEVAHVVRHYQDNFRENSGSPFLFLSSRGVPVSLRTVNRWIATLSLNLPGSAKRELLDRNHSETVSPHDLRHSCAVARLGQMIEAGESQEKACENLRAFFGWAPGSLMPLHYAEAHFEDRLNKLFREVMEGRTNFLRQLHRLGNPAALRPVTSAYPSEVA